MNANEYQKLAARTSQSKDGSRTYTEFERSVTEVVLMLASEVGGAAEYVKKAIFHNHGFDKDTMEKKLLDVSDCSVVARWVVAGTAGYAIDETDSINILRSSMGLVGESAELVKSIHKKANREEIVKELGDVMWYLSDLATEMGISLEEVMEGNIGKLKVRFPDGFTTEDSISRVDVEREEVQNHA